MQNKKFILMMGVLVLSVGAAAFVAGRLMTQRTGPLGLGVLFGDRGVSSVSVNVIRAPELPATSPDMTGAFIERQDNTLLVETKSLANGNVVTSSTTDTKSQTGPRVEVVITGETIIYRETTQPVEPLSAENQTIQQTVEQATLDDLDSRSMLMVWGRKSGDRIIAEVLMYSDIVAIKSAIFEDCEICP